MEHPDEQTIELFVLGQIAVTEEHSDSLATHLVSCDECRQVADRLRGFHEDLRDSPRTTSPAVNSLLDSWYPRPERINLVPFKILPHSSAGQPYLGVLAAMTAPAAAAHSFETIATLASEADHALLRIQHSASTSRVRFYYHTDDPRRREGAILRVPALPGDVVLDDHGHLECDAPDHVVLQEWASRSVVVSLPVVSVTIDLTASAPDATHVHRFPVTGGSFALAVRRSGGMVDLTVDAEGPVPQIRRAVARSAGGVTVIIALHDGSCRFAIPDEETAVRIRLYS